MIKLIKTLIPSSWSPAVVEADVEDEDGEEDEEGESVGETVGGGEGSMAAYLG